MARNLRVYVSTSDSESSPLGFETVESVPVPTNVLPHIKSLRMDVSNLDGQQRRLLCNALREAADFIEWGSLEYAELFRGAAGRESRIARASRIRRPHVQTPGA
jgi:hypothetical protein